MANSDHLTQHLLRTILLEGENGERILNAVRSFKKGDQTEQAHYALMDTLKKEVTKTTRELLADEQVQNFVDEVLDQI